MKTKNKKIHNYSIFNKMLCIFLGILLFAACNANDSGNRPDVPDGESPAYFNEFDNIYENPFINTVNKNKSAFDLNVSGATYPLLAHNILNGIEIKRNTVRIEDIVNYFDYNYPLPEEEILSAGISVFGCPWNENSKLLTIGIKAGDIEMAEANNNLVFLIDVSGSMSSLYKLPLLKEILKETCEKFKANDKVSFVTYAGTSSILKTVDGDDKTEIINTINSLEALGETAGNNGIIKAFALAGENFIPGGNNRIVLCTDGDFKLGMSSMAELYGYVENTIAENGIILSALGFGYGSRYTDTKIETIADRGNGNFRYINTLSDGKISVLKEMGGSVNTIAENVKAELEFNKNKVEKYRLLGYENKLTEGNESPSGISGFDIRPGFCLTAVYEIILNDSGASEPDEYLSLNITYNAGEQISKSCDEITAVPNDDLKFISCLIEFALVLRNSPNKGDASFESVNSRLNGLDLSGAKRAGFKEVVEMML